MSNPYVRVPHPFERDLKFLMVLAIFAFGLSAAAIAILLVRWLLR